MPTTRLFPLAALLVLTWCWPALAQRDLKDILDPDPEIERKQLEVADGFEINLYAADPLLAKPIQINFDERGRLWVASSEVYPQIQPGQKANDKVLVLEDADGDGRAEKTTVFADGLLIPTGVVPGDGGAYVANSTDLVHLADSDGDLKADRSRIVLSGFGTEDTHHILHTLRWGYDGMLYMNQSIYIHSHIETPYGVRRMNGGGIWQFRPETLELETFMLGLVNSWGHHFDRYGTAFATDGAGGEGINYVFPGWVGVTSPGAKRILHGLNPGSPKHCGLEIVGGSHLPDDWQGNFITNDFRAHRVCRFIVTEDGSGFASRQEKELVKSGHVAFRPIDVKQGPDGAIYIADWYNPIIQHGEVDFRDPRRDHVHGRIWRVTAKGRPLVPRPKLGEMSVDELLAQLTSPEPWNRQFAKQVLKSRGATAVSDKLAAWTAAIDADATDAEHQKLEALWTWQSLNIVEPRLLVELLRAKDPGVRAAATRVLYQWHAHVPGALDLLAVQVADTHPRVRLEAVRALSRLDDPRTCPIAMRALDQPLDQFLDFALWTTARDLAGVWLPALKAGKLDFDGDVKHLAFALQAAESPDVVPLLIEQLKSEQIDAAGQHNVLASIVALAKPNELETLLKLALDEKLPADRRARLLEALASATLKRKAMPSGDLRSIAPLLTAQDATLQAAALRAAGVWKLEPLRGTITDVATAAEAAPVLRQAAIKALAQLGGEASEMTLDMLSSEGADPSVRVMAAAALVAIDAASAAPSVVKVLAGLPATTDPHAILAAVLERKAGPPALAKALSGKKLPTDVAKLALRAVRSTGVEQPELSAALATAGGIKVGPKQLAPAELAALVAAVRDTGSAERGEQIYRRAEQACLKCHAVGGAGGQVGPDLVSIGATAQIDYLVESLLNPTAKIKENYHSLAVVTDEGQVLTGVKVRQTDTELILRNADDREIRIALSAIDEQRDAGSLMPVGLTDSLTQSELVDLVRFLSELGKPGPFALGKQQYVRRWQTPQVDGAVKPAALGTPADIAASSQRTWSPIYSRVNGELPLADLAAVPTSAGNRVFARFAINVTTAGEIQLQANSAAGLTAFVDGAMTDLAKTINLPRGEHLVVTAIDPAARHEPLRIELAPVAGSPTQAQIVGGK